MSISQKYEDSIKGSLYCSLRSPFFFLNNYFFCWISPLYSRWVLLPFPLHPCLYFIALFFISFMLSLDESYELSLPSKMSKYHIHTHTHAQNFGHNFKVFIGAHTETHSSYCCQTNSSIGWVRSSYFPNPCHLQNSE